MEIQMGRRQEIGEWVGQKNPTLRHIMPRMIAERLLKDLKILHLDKPRVCDRSAIWYILSKKYSSTQTENMRHYWEDKQKMTREEMLANGYSARTICYWKGSSGRRENEASQLKAIKLWHHYLNSSET